MIIQRARVLDYPAGAGFLAALRDKRSPRALWQVTPSTNPGGDWALGLATAARACADSERGAVIIVPDQSDLDRLSEACRARSWCDWFRRVDCRSWPSGSLPSLLVSVARRGAGGHRESCGRVRAGS